MAKEMRYGLVIWVSGNAARALKSIGRSVRNVGKAAKGLAFGSRGILGSLGLGGLASGGLFAPIIGAVKFVVGGVVSLVKGVIGTVVGLVKGAVRLVTGLISGIVGLVKKVALVGTAAVVALSAGLLLLIKRTANAGDAFAKMSKRTGMSVEFLSEMAHVLKLNDANLGNLLRSFKGMGTFLEGAERGLTEYTDILRMLGVRLRDNRGRLKDSETLFMDFARAIARVENPTLRAGLASRIFGKAALDVLPVVTATKGNLRAARLEASRLGLTWSGPAAAAAEKFNDALTNLWGALKGVYETALKPILDPLTRQIDRVTAAIAARLLPRAKEFGAWAASKLPELFTKIGQLKDAVVGFFQAFTWEKVKTGFGIIREEAGKLRQDLFGMVPEFVGLVMGAVSVVAVAAKVALTTVLDYFQARLVGMLDRVGMGLMGAGAKMQREAPERSWAAQYKRMSGWQKTKQAWAHPLSTLWAMTGKLGLGAAGEVTAGKAMFGFGAEVKNLGARVKGGADQAELARQELHTVLGDLVERQGEFNEALRGIVQEIRAIKLKQKRMGQAGT